ncbi:MAG: inositol monophosphatase [Burkholderiaceae bacterium]|jgi:fructose-1,6-bisphosphatase/inositol monophosphatase family enzyme|nr:inositol monophosphatase [Burkholderiaceae bacterium]
MIELPLKPVDLLIRQTAKEQITPKWGRLEDDEIQLKAPDEWVTALDRNVEKKLTFELSQLIPGSTVVGEEQCATTPRLLDSVDQGTVWLLDPIDGTRNLVEGTGPISVMVALLKDGETLASWMFNPLTDVMYYAIKGAGAWVNAQRVAIDAHAILKGQGIVRTRFLPEAVKAELASTAANLQLQPGSNCAGDDYPSLVLGGNEFALYWRTLPWDHAPGALFVREAGGVVARLDGTPYRPGQKMRGLLVARNPTAWSITRNLLPAICL